MMELDSMLEKVETFVRWVSRDDDSYSVSKTIDSRMIIIVRNNALPPPTPSRQPQSQPQQQQQLGPSVSFSSALPPSRSDLQLARQCLNPESPEFLPSSQSSSGTGISRRSEVDENNNYIGVSAATVNGVPTVTISASSLRSDDGDFGVAAGISDVPAVRRKPEAISKEAGSIPKEIIGNPIKKERAVKNDAHSEGCLPSARLATRALDAVVRPKVRPSTFGAAGAAAVSPRPPPSVSEVKMWSPPAQKELRIGETLRMIVSWIEDAETKKQGKRFHSGNLKWIYLLGVGASNPCTTNDIASFSSSSSSSSIFSTSYSSSSFILIFHIFPLYPSASRHSPPYITSSFSAFSFTSGPLILYAHFEDEESSLESMTNEITTVMEGVIALAASVSPTVRTGIHVLTPHHGKRLGYLQHRSVKA